MALRNQPYIPLYVQDFLTDEKLMECSALANGVYIRLMCVMHKSESYGTILLKQKDKQSDKQVLNFANKVAKFLPWDLQTIVIGIEELLEEKVLFIDGDLLKQKRMIKDGDISDKRASAGSKGGNKTLGKPTKRTKKFAQAKSQANSENENENENENEDNNDFEKEKRGVGEKEILLIPDEFKPLWNEWLEYRKAKKKKDYAGLKWEQMAVDKFIKLSNNNIERAKLIILQTVENNWEGLFELKVDKNGTTKSNTEIGIAAFNSEAAKNFRFK